MRSLNLDQLRALVAAKVVDQSIVLREPRQDRLLPSSVLGDIALPHAERHELGSGLGFAGRLRAWWALPPVIGRRGPYTG